MSILALKDDDPGSEDTRNGFPLFPLPSDSGIVTPELLTELRDATGLYRESKGFKRASPHPEKSLTLRVTRVRPCKWAVAAISISAACRVWPVR